MPRPERPIPDWAQQERQTDLAWIQGNLPDFQSVATTSFDSFGRVVIVVDTRINIPHAGHPFTYLEQAILTDEPDPDIHRMLDTYNPEEEFVVVLLKQSNHTSTYRVRALPQQP